MATGYFFKRNTDEGAPALTNVAGTLIAVLDWVLDVNNPDAHWEKVYFGTNIAVYRAKTGERRYLRVDDSIGDRAYVRGYESMTDASSGTDPFPLTTQYSNANFYVYKATSSAARSWVAVGDSRFFLMGCRPSNGPIARFMFGEVSTSDPLDAYTTCLFAPSATGESNSSGGSIFALALNYTTNSRTGYFARSADGINKSMPAVLEIRGVINQTAMALDVQTVLPLDSVRAYSGPSSAQLSYRGTIPYLYSFPAGVDTSIYPVTTVLPIAGSEYMLFDSNSSSYSYYAALRYTNDEPGRS